jgi:phage terminase large subunit
MTSTATLNPNLRTFWNTPARNRVLYGGRDSSKTWDAAGFAIFLAQAYKIRFMATRQFQNRIADSVYTVLCHQIERFGVSHLFEITNTSIYCPSTGSDFIFYGRSRNISDIKGVEGVDIHWAEECELMTDEEWSIIDPTLRKEGSQHWLIFNPRLSADFVYQRFIVNPPADTVVRKINYDENPFLSNTSRKRIEAMKIDDYDSYEHYYLGVPWTDDDRVIIKLSWIEAAIDAHIKLNFAPDGRKIIGFDVADDGADKCANVYAHGSVALWCEEWKGGEDELLKSCSRTYASAQERGAEIGYDCIGVGASAGGKFDELNLANSNLIKYHKFNAGDSVHEPEKPYKSDSMAKIKNKDFFSNLKAQSWWLIADRFRNTYDAIHNGTRYNADELISISSDMPMLEKLKTELSTPRRDFDANGRVKVESKKDLAKRDVPSPNIADAFVIAFAPTKSTRSWFG